MRVRSGRDAFASFSTFTGTGGAVGLSKLSAAAAYPGQERAEGVGWGGGVK